MDPREVIESVMDVFNKSDVYTFRIHESQVEIEMIKNDKIVLSLYATPLSMPVRVSDIIRLARHLTMNLKEYDPMIEIVKT